MKRKCKKCNKTKDISLFVKNKRCLFGFTSSCRACHRIYEQKYNIKRYSKDSKYRTQRLKSVKKYMKANKEKLFAQRKLNHAIRSGKIVRPDKCSRCKKKCIPDAHHPNYEKYFDVLWLCRTCHKAEHKIIKASCAV